MASPFEFIVLRNWDICYLIESSLNQHRLTFCNFVTSRSALNFAPYNIINNKSQQIVLNNYAYKCSNNNNKIQQINL